MFKPNDIVVEIGKTLKWRILEVRENNYRVESIGNPRGHCISSFDKVWVERDFLKVNVYHWAYGEEQDDEQD